MKVALLQGEIDWNEPEKNVERYSKLIEHAHTEGAALVVLPEMFTTGFSFPSGDAAIKASELGSSLLEQAARKHTAYLCGSVPLLIGEDPRPYNSLRLFGPHGHVADYSKVHLFSMEGEDKRYRPGDSIIRVPIFEFRVSFSVCYDLRFAQYYAALAPYCDLFVISANWPEVRQQHWESLLVARAIENQAYVVGVNCVGKGGNAFNYIGGSMAVSPRGEILTKGGSEEEVLIAQLEIDEVRKLRSSFPVFKDRRPDIYSGIGQE